MYDIVIIGAGPAGLTAALYAGRFRLNTLILEKSSIGGQIVLSSVIENFPGFPGGISTTELIDRIYQQIQQLGINVQTQEVLKISASSKLERPVYTIITKDNSYQTKAVVITTGSQPKRMGVNGEDRLTGKGVSYCATCDAPLFRDKDVVVIGGGDKAIEEAIFLSGFAKRITVVHRRSHLRASGILQEKAHSNPKINFILQSVVEEIIGEDKVQAVKIKNVSTGSVSNLAGQGVFIFVGIKPNTDFVKEILKLDELGFIITDQDLKTSSPGIFAGGDCRKKTLYQVITACGDGAVACDSVHRYLS